MQVPLDYSQPAGRRISLALMRLPVKDQSRRIGSVLMNPGGPGGSGIDFLRRDATKYFQDLNSRMDLVTWDPRGVGASTPVKCLDDAQLDKYLALDTVIDDAQEERAWVDASRNFAIGCERNSASLLPFMDSDSTARDMDSIRAALGDARLTYIGFSYGTYIGQWYAHLFPTHVRALALDGVVDSADTGRASALEQFASFQQNLEAFLADCRAHATCEYGRSGDPAAKLDALMARLDKTPIAVGSRQLTRTLAMDAVLASMYNQNSWPKLQLALAVTEGGDGRGMLAIADSWNERKADGTYDNFMNGAHAATACIEGFQHPRQIEFSDPIAAQIEKASPFFGPSLEWDGLYCAFWPELPRPYRQLTIAGAPPILLIGATNDPATPYQWAKSVSQEIAKSVLLTRVGNGHTSYFFSGCITAAENAYLENLTLPSAGASCS